MSRFQLIGACALLATVLYGVSYFVRKRNSMKGLPSPPGWTFLWGNLSIANECASAFPPGTHVHHWATYLYKKYNLGDIFYVDWWPLGPRFLWIADPEVASQYVTTGTSLPKSPLQNGYLNQFLGDRNIVTSEGAHWKHLRSMFTPGFSASHLMTLVPYIVDASLVFYKVIDEKARTGELFELEDSASKLTIDIIGKVVLDSDFNSQKGTHPIVETFRTRVGLMRNSSFFPWQNVSVLRPFRLWANARKLDALISKELDAMHKARAGKRVAKSFRERKKTVVDLALDTYEGERTARNVEEQTVAPLDAQFRRDIVDSMKTFIFAGHDTTASTIAYTYYLLHFHPQAFNKLLVELDSVFGAGSTYLDIAQTIKENPYIISKLEYTTAIIKEVLRIFPPASSVRYMPEGSNEFLVDPSTGRKLPLAGVNIWTEAHLYGRNEKFFPQPEDFIPERFIPSQTPFPNAMLFTPAGKDAWRPFEKGPRNCIGQELAMIESKVILALVTKEFDFVAEYDGIPCDRWTATDIVKGAENGKENRTVEGHRCYQILRGSAKPAGGMPGRMSRRAFTEKR